MFRKWLYYGRDLIHRPSNYDTAMSLNDKVLYVSTNSEFSVLMTNNVPEYALLTSGKGFLKNLEDTTGLLDVKYDNVVGNYDIDKADIVYYVYGLLHSPEYRDMYANDLKKSLARIPLVRNKEAFIRIGKELSNLHLNYEKQVSYPGVTVSVSSDDYKVTKMKHPKKGALDTIIFNNSITISNIPEKAYEYVVSGRPAIEWIIDQYQVKTDKKSGITDDPNEFSDNPKYILNLLLSVITVSMRTLELIEELPEFEIQE